MTLRTWLHHPPGWLALAVLAGAMAIVTWPERMSPAELVRGLLRSFQAQGQEQISTGIVTEGPSVARAPGVGTDPFSRATGTPLPVLATVPELSPSPPGPAQVVKCKVPGRVVYADTWSACPKGMGELVSLYR